jgi:FixJ family two-component response regulator
MPEMDGRAVAQVAKRISPKTPVILLTGWGIFMKSAVEKPEGVDFILSKPPSGADLTEGLRSVISHGLNHSPTLN